MKHKQRGWVGIIGVSMKSINFFLCNFVLLIPINRVEWTNFLPENCMYSNFSRWGIQQLKLFFSLKLRFPNWVRLNFSFTFTCIPSYKTFSPNFKFSSFFFLFLCVLKCQFSFLFFIVLYQGCETWNFIQIVWQFSLHKMFFFLSFFFFSLTSVADVWHLI